MDLYSIAFILHILGIALGAGGAFTSDALFLFSLRDDKKLSATELRLLHIAGRVVWTGLALLFASGLVLLWLGDWSLLGSSVFQAKMTIVVLIVLNGLAFHRVHLPFLERVFAGTKAVPDIARRSLMVFLSGALSSASWISVIVLGYLRVMPWSYTAIMGVYLLVVAAAVPGALVVKRLLFVPGAALERTDRMNRTDRVDRSDRTYVVGRWRMRFITALIGLLVAIVLAGGVPLLRNRMGEDEYPASMTLTPKAELPVADVGEVHLAYAPDVPPPIVRDEQRIVDVHFEILEAVCEIDPKTGTKTETWGYRIAGDSEVRCGAPGPVLRARVGDMLRITLTNLLENREPHNIDFHAVTGPGGGAKALTVAPGETATVEARMLYPGVFMYHCAYGDPPMHVTYGMVGMVIVDPETPLPSVEHEWAVMQSEWYLGEPDAEGIAQWDRDAVLAEEPRFITFNGRTDALTDEHALTMRTGERARIYFANQGMNLAANFHAIGSHWDVVYPEGATSPGNPVIRGSQTTLVAAGGGTVVELVAQVPGNIILVDHALSRTFYKGAIGIITVDGPDNLEIFATSGETADGSGDAHGDAGPVREMTIDAGSYFYSMDEIRVRKGERVRLTINNVGGTHDLVIDELGVKTNRIETGEKASVEFTAGRAGSFVYYCSVGDHRLRGQWGTLIVEE